MRLRRWAVVVGRSPSLAVFVVALTLRLVVLALAVLGPGRLIWLPDSLEYDLLGRNLALHGVFSQSPAPPFAPDYQRTPLFPLQVALAYLLAGGRPGLAATLAAAANAVLGALTAALLVPIGTALGGRRAGLWAGLLLAVDLTSIVYSAMLLTEALFALLLVGALLALARYAGSPLSPGARLAALAGVALGLATLTRPIGILLPLVFGPCFFLARGWRGWPFALRDLVLCGLVAGAIVAPWSLRARAAGADDATATQVAINAYFHRGALIEAARTGRAAEDVRAELEVAFEREAVAGGWTERQRVEVMRERAARLIEEHRLLYLRLQLRGMLQLLGPETDALFDVAGLRRAPHEGPSRPVRELWRLLGMGQLALVYALAVAGAMALVRARRWAALALLALPLAYFVVVSGPEAYARFRVPAMPEVVLLAAVAGSWPRAVWPDAKKPGG